ncbi:hypothetical protein [Sphingomonas bacterium]|uniref:tellurite resistance TerB family protein n=1 Tax=Sphingomonas bacterium TaxID=1895847 RepID=UPI00157505ED|nr:hypothetical protein [Sphingomonas bacterium]
MAPTENDIWPGEPNTPFRRLWAEVKDKRVEPPRSDVRIAVTFEDEPGGSAVRRDNSSAWVAQMRYRDAKGRETERLFRCLRLTQSFGKMNVMAWCYEREAVRQFCVDNIIELADAYTGECFDPLLRFEQLRDSGALGCDDMVLTDLARVLQFMAGCDGEYHPLEREAIVTQLERYALRFDGCEKALERVVAGLDDIAPDGTDLVRAVKKFSRMRDGARFCRFVLDSGAAVIDADGRQTPDEVRWAVELSATLKGVVDRGALH